MASRILVRRSAPTETGEAGALYVSTTGNDTTGTGTISNPFLTLGKARDAVRALNDSMSADIHVYLRGGRYPLTSTVVFDAQDSGTNGFDVVYRAYAGEQPRLSGGTALTGFSDAGSGRWTKDVGSLRFRQLYVNGTRCWRARNPNKDSYGSLSFWDTGSSAIEITASHIGTTAPANLTSVELVVLGHGVNSCYLRVASVSGSGGTRVITPQEPERTRIFQQAYPPKGTGNNYWCENALEYLDQQGEFYINPSTNLLSYMKRTAEDLSTAEVMAPALERLIQVQGTSGTEVNHLRFEGLIFEHSTWLSPNSNGFVGDQAFTEFVTPVGGDEITSYPSVPHPAAVHVEHAKFVDFYRCIFRHCGSSAINLYRNCDDCSIIGCVIHDISAGGITVDCNLQGNPASAVVLCERPTIQNNYITAIGLDYHQNVAIATTYVIAPLIEHNEVSVCPYSGISVGWGWADVENDMSGAIVRNNELWDTHRMEDDGGSIYTLSRQDNGLITLNYVHDVTTGVSTGGHPVAGIYLDNGTGEITVSNNVLVNCSPSGDGEVFQNGNGAGVTLSNNAGNTPTGNEGLEAAFVDIRDLVE